LLSLLAGLRGWLSPFVGSNISITYVETQYLASLQQPFTFNPIAATLHLRSGDVILTESRN